MNPGDIILTINATPYYQTLVNFVGETIALLLLYTIGIFLYSVFIWYFYKKLSKRDLLELDLMHYDFDVSKWAWLKKTISVALYIVEYCFVFPIYIFFWFSVTTLLMFVIAETGDVGNILLISMSLIATVRVASYFKEELSNDIAKLLPFALLAVIITNPLFFSVEELLERISQLPNFFVILLDFITFIFVVEISLRVLYLLYLLLKGKYMKERMQLAEAKMQRQPRKGFV
jgi:hypothetical protein